MTLIEICRADFSGVLLVANSSKLTYHRCVFLNIKLLI